MDELNDLIRNYAKSRCDSEKVVEPRLDMDGKLRKIFDDNDFIDENR